MDHADKHVVSGLNGGWGVRSTGAAKAMRLFRTRAEAIAFARQEARKAGGNLFIHNEDGSVRDVSTYERRAG